MNLKLALLLLPGLIIGLTIHEASHALSAKLLGDRTAYKMGRVSLNPFRHLSLLGTAALFLLGFGWGKPVLVNLYNFKKPKLYYLLSSLAGPVSNLLLATTALGILYLKPHWIISFLAYSVFFVNVLLAVVNLVPVPPLDGSKIWPCLIPGLRPTVSGKWSAFWIIFLLIALYTGFIGTLISFVLHLMTPLLPARMLGT
jgi:Zn-dependent protease